MPQWEYLKLVATVIYRKSFNVSNQGTQTIKFELEPVRTKPASRKQVSEETYQFNPEQDRIDPIELVTSHMDEHICKLGLSGWELVTLLSHGNGSSHQFSALYMMSFLFKRPIRKKPEP